MDISKYKEETLHELNKIKQEQLEIEKTCLKLSELKDNVIIMFCLYITYIFVIQIYLKLLEIQIVRTYSMRQTLSHNLLNYIMQFYKYSIKPIIDIIKFILCNNILQIELKL